jgi:tetratricopeptide (TPR) repeat protein
MKLKILFVLLLGSSTAFAADYTLQTLEKALGMFRAATNSAMYAEAAQQYEYLVEEEGIRNGDLFYTLGNTWFLAGDVGRAILNYRRAEQYLPNNADVQHNLKTALEQRTDLIPEKEPHPLAAKLLGWHFNTPAAFRWWGFAACWLVAWGAWLWLGRSRKKEARATVAVAGILSVALMASLLAETILKRGAEPGVIVAAEVLARKGDGEIYAPAFLDPLHSGTEFQRLENRDKWWRIRLADGQECWIPAKAAEMVSL